MSDSEHEYLVAHEALRMEVARLREVATRAIAAAIDAQETAAGRHDDWLDAALVDLGPTEDAPYS
jgi:hypothetical protein